MVIYYLHELLLLYRFYIHSQTCQTKTIPSVLFLLTIRNKARLRAIRASNLNCNDGTVKNQNYYLLITKYNQLMTELSSKAN